jgi:plastocyanin
MSASGSERSSLTRREALALLASGALAACFSDRPDDGVGPGDDEVEVSMTANLRFDPETVQIEAGQTVVWRNTSGFVHTATGDASLADDPDNVRLPAGAQPWDSGSVPAGGEYRRTFDVAGEYRYFCIPHEGQDMTGRIIVA